MTEQNDDALVCVLCGRPWEPAVKNRCECGGFCTWGTAKDGDPDSWDVHPDGSWTPKPPPTASQRATKLGEHVAREFEEGLRTPPDPKAVAAIREAIGPDVLSEAQLRKALLGDEPT